MFVLNGESNMIVPHSASMLARPYLHFQENCDLILLRTIVRLMGVALIEPFINHKFLCPLWWRSGGMTNNTGADA